MTYQPKTEAGKFVLETGMMVAASEPEGGCINWEAIVQDMEEGAAKLERERLRAEHDAMVLGATEEGARVWEAYQRNLRAARDLADELGHELKRWHDEAHRTSCPFICPTRAALAKWEASHVE